MEFEDSTKELTCGSLPIYKNGDNRECRSYKGISLVCVSAKVYETIINRIKQIIEVDEAQWGFRKGRSIQDQIFNVKQRKCKTKQISVHCFH